LSERARAVADRLGRGRYVNQCEELANVMVVSDVTGEHALGEHRGGDDDVICVLAKGAQTSPSLRVDRRQPVDAAGVEDDDQPAALAAWRFLVALVCRR
jgi:hypothetical protein